MKKVYVSILAMAAALAPLAAGAWTPAGDHISTPWAADVNPEKPWNVYPRPIMERTAWRSEERRVGKEC